jgi:inner membrane protein
VDIFTHALASVAVARVATPPAPLSVWAAVVVAGTIADIDGFSALFGPSAYLTWHHNYTHSLLAALIVALLLAVVCDRVCHRPTAVRSIPRLALFLTIASVGLLHLALDACGSDGIALFWPLSRYRVATDWLPSIDPWIIAILVAAILLPELLHLVSSEIGSKEKRPRGRVGAIIGLAFVLLYIGVRATIHSNAAAAIEARSYQGESPRRVAVFPESVSPFTWHAIVETDRALHELNVNTTPRSAFDPERGVTLFKPESSPMLDDARNSDAAKKFLQVARFPKASIEKTTEGYNVQLRDLRYAASRNTHREIAVIVKIDVTGKILDDVLVWARDLHRR